MLSCFKQILCNVVILVLVFIRFIIGVIVLGLGAYTDIKTRGASNILWVVLGGSASLMLAFEYLTDPNIMLLILPIIWIVLFYILFQLELIYGGADCKALMSISILVPFFVVDVFIVSGLVMFLCIPFISFMKKLSMVDVVKSYGYPFLFSLFIGFIIVFFVSGFFSVSLFDFLLSIL